MVMTDSADASQIARLASSAVPSLSPVRCAGVHVANRGWLESAGPCLRRSVRTAVEKQLRGLHGQAGPIRVEGERWAWALPMRSLEGAFGHVVIAGEAPVQDTESLSGSSPSSSEWLSRTRISMPVSVRPPRRLGS